MPFCLLLGYCVIYMHYSDKKKRRLMHQLLYIYRRSEIVFAIYIGYGRVVKGAGLKAKRLVPHCINAVSSNPVEGRTRNILISK